MTVLEGPIEAANERGIRVQGEWANVSTYRKVELPDVGTPVRLEVDAKGWIKTLATLERPVPNGTRVSHSQGQPGEYPVPNGTDRERTITRIAVLQAAAAFMGDLGQAREQIKADHVLAVADRWLAWVEQD